MTESYDLTIYVVNHIPKDFQEEKLRVRVVNNLHDHFGGYKRALVVNKMHGDSHPYGTIRVYITNLSGIPSEFVLSANEDVYLINPQDLPLLNMRIRLGYRPECPRCGYPLRIGGSMHLGCDACQIVWRETDFR